MAQCRSCGQKIDWIKTTKGKNMPVDEDYYDYDECENGMILVTDGGMVVTVNEHQNMPSVRGRISHFASCPQANNWRKKDER